jgi:hypothetical protein
LPTESKRAYKFHENVAKFKYMGMLATIQFRDLSLHLLSKDVKIKIYKTINLLLLSKSVKLVLSYKGTNMD